MANDFESLRTLLSDIRKDGAYSDLTVLCESSVFKVHSCIVCPQSSFFEKAISGQFQEARSREITLEDNPLIVARMFDYLYCAAYDDTYERWSITEPAQDTPEQKESAEPSETATIDNADETSAATIDSFIAEGSRARINAAIYAIADKYRIEGLMKLSKQKLQSHLQSNWKYPEFIDTVRYVYGPDSPPHSELRDILSRSAIQHLSALQHQQLFHDILKTFATFSYDFSVLMIEKVLQLEQELCDKQTIQHIVWKPTVDMQSNSHPRRTSQNRGSYCSDCNRSFINGTGLRQHDTDYHYWCTDCEKNFLLIKKARSHRAGYHGGY